MDAAARNSLEAHSAGGLGSYWRAVRLRWPLVVVITLAALGGALFLLSVTARDWEATAEVLVTPLDENDSAFLGFSLLRGGDPVRTVQTAAALIASPRAADATAQRMGRGWNRDAVLGSVRVEPQGESNVLGVTAIGSSPEIAAKLANEYAAAALAIRVRVLQRQLEAAIGELEVVVRAEEEARRAQEERFERPSTGNPSLTAERLAQLQVVRGGGGDPTLSLAQAAISPTEPIGAPPALVLAAALVAGLTLAVLAALALEGLGRRVREQGELVSLYPLPVLAGIPPMSRRERRSSAVPPPPVREAFRTLRVQLEQLGSGRTILLTSGSSGDGKTTAAANLGLALVEAGHRVVLVDFDLRHPGLSEAVGVQPERGLVSTLGASDIRSSLIESPFAPGLLVLPAVEGDVALLELVTRRLPDVLSEALELPADYVIVDAAPLGEVSDALGLAGQVDDVIVVARPGNTNRNAFELMRGLLERTGVDARGLVVMGQRLQSSSGYHLQRPISPEESNARREADVAGYTR